MMKGQKGITLVALVITIIVMLILVGVTISVAMNGGLFEKADEANRETKKAQVSEAAALAKAEILADFYSAKNDSERAKPEASAVKTLVDSYLGDNTITTTVTATDTGYTVSTDLDFDEDITIDLTGVTFYVAPADPNGNGDA